MTNSTLQRFATAEPTACAVCRRHAVWLGYAPKQGAKAIWLCGDVECSNGGKEIYQMSQANLDAYEVGAALEAGELGGAFLDEIGKTDMATLDGDEWREFLRRIIVGFEKSMKQKILSGAAPF